MLYSSQVWPLCHIIFKYIIQITFCLVTMVIRATPILRSAELCFVFCFVCFFCHQSNTYVPAACCGKWRTLRAGGWWCLRNCTHVEVGKVEAQERVQGSSTLGYWKTKLYKGPVFVCHSGGLATLLSFISEP